MKYLLVVLALVVAAMSQTQPVQLHVSPNHVEATNASTKEIVMVSVIVSSQYKGKYANPDFEAVHDFYFKPGGVPVGDMFEVVHPAGESFVQFADGSSWGDTNGENTQLAISRRRPVLDFYEKVLKVYQEHGEAAFVDELNNAPQGFLKAKARHFLLMQKDGGTQAAIAQIQERFTAAKGRPF